MSHINSAKSRLGEMFLRDRGNIDEKTAALIRSELKQMMERYFELSSFSVKLSPCDNGEVNVEMKSAGIKLRSHSV